MAGSSDATLSVDARLNNFVSADIETMLKGIETSALGAGGSLVNLSASATRASLSLQSLGKASVVTQAGLIIPAQYAPMLQNIGAQAAVVNTNLGATTVATTKTNDGLKQLGGTLTRSARIASIAGMAVGGAGGAMGGLGPVTGAASAAIGLFGAGLGPVGIAVAGVVVLLGALGAAFAAADKKALEASERGLKKMAERTAEISSASKQVVGAQSRAGLAEIGDNSVARLQFQQQEELKNFKGTEGQKQRMADAFGRERNALAAKLNKDAYAKRLEVETKLEGELVELDLSVKKKGLEKEIALIRSQQRTKLEAAIKGGADEGYAREVIAEQTALRISEVEIKYGMQTSQKLHDISLARIDNMSGSIERGRAQLEESYRFEVAQAIAKGEAVDTIDQMYAEKRKQLRREENQQISEATFNLASSTLSVFSGINEVQSARLRARTKERIELVEEQERQGILTKRQAEKSKEKIEKDSLKRQHALGKQAQKFAYAEAVINVAQGITKAFAQGGVLGFITGAAVAAAGGAQIAKINAQEFEEGGFPSLGGSRGTLIRVNEGGRQEAVLNAGATKRLGRSAINELNRGGNVTTNSAPQYNYAPNVTIQVTGADPKEVVRALENQKKEFFTFLEEAGRRGYRG